MKIYLNEIINLGLDRPWERQNGMKRKALVLVNNRSYKGEALSSEFPGNLSYLDKGNHSFIYINDDSDLKGPKIAADTAGIFLNDRCGYTVLKGETFYESSSTGGYGNMESKFGIYGIGTIIKLNTYQEKEEGKLYCLTSRGWIETTKESVYETEESGACWDTTSNRIPGMLEFMPA